MAINEYTISKIELPNGDICNIKDTTYTAGTGLKLTNTTFKNERGIEYIRGTWGEASNVWTGTSADSELYDGKQIILYMPFAGTSTAATLNLTLSNGSTTGAKNVYFESTNRFTTHKAAHSQLHLIYHKSHNISGTNYEGWWYIANRDTTTTNATQLQHNFAVKAGSTAIVGSNLIVADSDGLYKHLKSGTVFDITMPIFYTSVAIAANSTATNNYTEINFAVSTTQSMTLTAHLPVYIKGTLSGTKFTPVSTAPLTQMVPTSDDGYAYMFLGMAYNQTTIRLKNYHPIYMYKNNKFQLWLENSGATAGSYGDSSNQTPSYGGTFKVPYVTVDNKGRVTSISEHTVKIPASDNTNTTYTFGNGTNGFTVTPSNGTAQTVTVTPSITNNVTGSGNDGYLAKFNGANTITNGPKLGTDATKFLNSKGEWATALTSHQDISGKVSKSGDDMTGDLGIIFGDKDKFIHFKYNTSSLIDNSWRLGVLGSGSGEANYFIIQSGGNNNSSNGEWKNAIRIGQRSYDVAFGGNVYPLVDNSKTLGTDSNKWANVYATTFTGNLTGTASRATGDADGNAIKTTYAKLASPTFTGTPKSVTPSSSSDGTMIATKEYVDNSFAANDAMIFKGTIGSSGANVTALPAIHNVGWTYRVITPGKYANIQCEMGDLIICITNGTAANDAHWTIAQTNIDGAVIGPTSSTTNHVALFSDTSGKVIKDSGVSLGTMATETATNYLKWQSTSITTANTIYDFGIYVKQGSADTSTTPSGNAYYNILNIPYRKASGNNKADYAWSIASSTASDNRLFFRTSNADTYGAWQEVAHAPVGTTTIGGTTQPVYMTATGVITAGTALKALAYKDNLVASDIPDISGTYATKTYVNTNAVAKTGDTMTGQLKTSFKQSVAIGSCGTTQTTVEGLCEEMRFSSGCMGSVSIDAAYTHNGITIPVGWYTYIWVPHRSGGLNGTASGDNCNYGTLYLNAMTASGTNNSFVVRYCVINSTSQIGIIVANANFNTVPVEGQVLISKGAYGHIQSSGYTIAKSVPSNAVFTDTNNAATHTLNTTTKYYITGTTSASTSTSGDAFDTGVYVTTTAGELSAVKHSFNVGGTEKATMQYNNDIESIVFSFV